MGDIMFAILDFYEEKRRIGSFLSRDKIDSERVVLLNEEVFFKVRIKKRRGKIPWKKLSQCLGILREDVLLSEAITIPDSVGITKFKPEKYHLITFFSSVVENIKSQGKIYGSLCVYDEKGLFMPYVTELVNLFSQIKIITPFMQEYERLGDEIFSRYGMTLLITDKGKLDGDVVIAPDSTLVDITFSGTVYTLQRRFLLSGVVLCPKNLLLPSYCREMCPEGIDPFIFAAALYEKCSLDMPLQAQYTQFS